MANSHPSLCRRHPVRAADVDGALGRRRLLGGGRQLISTMRAELLGPLLILVLDPGCCLPAVPATPRMQQPCPLIQTWQLSMHIAASLCASLPR